MQQIINPAELDDLESVLEFSKKLWQCYGQNFSNKKFRQQKRDFEKAINNKLVWVAKS